LAPILPPTIALPVAKSIPTIGTSTSAGTIVEKIDKVIKAME